MRATTLASVLLAIAAAAQAADQQVICSFEDERDGRWEFSNGAPEWSDQHVSHGARSLRVATGTYMVSHFLPGDWSGYDSLDIDIFVEGSAPAGASLLVGDAAWMEKFATASYWNRHNGGFNLKPGANTVSIPVNGLYRGEAGCRNIDLKFNIDPKKIVRVDFGFSSPDPAAVIFIDHMRLVKEDRPAGILAFDLGPASQTVFPGFTPITWNTVHGSDGATAGFFRALGSANRARDDTFPTRLLQDWVDFGTDGPTRLLIDVPAAGTYHVWLVWSDLGYWGGEVAQFERRVITAEGREVDVEQRHRADYLYRFEDVEITPGRDVWSLYLADLFAPRRFAVDVADGSLELTVQAPDAAWSTKVAAIVVYPDAMKAEAERWLAGVEARNRDEALGRAVFMGPEIKELAVPADAAARGWWLGAPALADTVSFTDAPGAPLAKLARTVARGQRVATTFAVRPLRDLGAATLVASDLRGPGGAIPAANVDLRYAHHQTSRSFNAVAYVIQPYGLRPVAGSALALAKDLTRQFWVTVEVPADAKPGRYAGELTLSAGDLRQAVPLELEVLAVDLPPVDYPMGFFGLGLMPGVPDPDAAMREQFQLFRRHGMTSFTSGPSIAFRGFDASGAPILDTAACDRYLALARECGFTGEIFAYGGPGWIDGLYDGEHRAAWEASGKPFPELLKVVWGAALAHAKEAGWQRINYGVIDEPRTEDGVNGIIEFLSMHREAVPELRLGGFYSVGWQDDHGLHGGIQRIFDLTTWSAMNLHGPVDFAKAKEMDVELYLYNQGSDRRTHGAYSWARMDQGARGMINWHANALHGYQFFDLDGREPDFAMYHQGRRGLYPTLDLARSAEGVTDLRFAMALDRAARAAGDVPAAKDALAWLASVVEAMPPGTRDLPPTLAADDAFRDGCIERLRALAAR